MTRDLDARKRPRYLHPLGPVAIADAIIVEGGDALAAALAIPFP